MTGSEFEAQGRRLALAYASTREDGAAWMERWEAEDVEASDELMEWELEGYPPVRDHVSTSPRAHAAA